MSESLKESESSKTMLEDEPECEGLYKQTILELLKKKGYNIDDPQFREMHLLASTTFDPQAYMAHVHADTPIELLRSGLDNLEESMAQKSGSLKKLVESNFERFVRAKSTLDDVHNAMRNQGLEAGATDARRPHSRHASRNSAHFRSMSGQNALGFRGKPLTNERRKLALVKESEFGVQGIKLPLTDAAAKAEEVYNPALNSRDRVKLLQDLSGSLEECKEIVELVDQLALAVESKDYEKVVSCYNVSVEAKNTCLSYAKEHERTGAPLTDQQARRCVVTAKVLLSLDYQLEAFKRDVWRDLTSVQANLTMSTDRNHQDDYVALLSVLLSLGVEDNPIWVWLISRYDYLKNKINSTFERSRVEIEVFRRRLANADPPSPQAAAAHYKSPARSNSDERLKHLDSTPILELWEIIFHSLGNLLSVKGGVLGEILDFWEKAQSFITGQAQKSLPIGFEGISQKHHFLSAEDIKALQDGATELVDLLRDQVLAFFTEPPVEDVSLLFSPNPESPHSPKSASGGLSPFQRPDHRFNLDPNAPPPPSPKRGEAWEKFAFWPPFANALSGVHYLGRILALVGTGAAHMSVIGSPATKQSMPERLRSMVNAARERSSKAICSAWEHDAETSKVLEDWTRETNTSDTTCWPTRFQALESFIVSGVQQVLYISEAQGTKDAPTTIIITPPNSTLLNSIRKSFTNTIYLGLNGMVENVAQPAAKTDNPWTSNGRSLMDQRLSILSIRDAFDTSLKGPRMLLTLSNLGALNRAVIPTLVSEFETAFSMTLTDDVQRLNDMLTKFDQRMFRYYVSPISADVGSMIASGIASADWPGTSSAQPTAVSRFVYPALLRLVEVHSEVTNTAPSYVTKILRHLLEDASRAFLDAFRRRGRFPLAALVQATLDLEFFAQTLSQYATDESGGIQTEIYAVLDQGTDAQSRQQLQAALTSMKATLKQLREGSKAQFACFRRQKQ